VAAGIAHALYPGEEVMTYLIVGLDLKTHARWHGNLSAVEDRAAGLKVV